MNRARILGLGLIAIAVAGCSAETPLADPPEKGILRTRLFQQCMRDAGKFTPMTVADRGSWSEVISKCDDAAYYQANTCSPNYRECLNALSASAIEARSAETTGSARKGESAAPKEGAQ